ncbi:MAG: hypothetical protein NC203_04640 [Firmicutes bacterium]|nr:hypothetical protein [[Eubacterium] siraeum]MCM1487637.1 hypothetical protein [Bacillota bacterium]
MNTFNLAAMSLQKKVVITIMVIIELAVLFFAENYTVSAVKERTMLSAPYKSILSEDSLFVYDIQFPSKSMEVDNLTFRESQNELLEGFEENFDGNYKVYNILTYINPDVTDYAIYSVDDEIYRSLALPLVSGSYGGKANSAVAAPGLGSGSFAVETESGALELDICGTLTSSTYVPEFNLYNTEMSANGLYSPINGGRVIITGRSGLGEAEKSFNCSWGFIVKFDSPEAAEKGERYFSTVAAAVKGGIIRDNTNKLAANDMQSFIPILACVLFIVLIGIISISTMIFEESKYRSGILWLCGYSRKRIVMIQAASVGILLIASLAVFVLLTVVLNSLASGGLIDSDSFIKINFGFGNFAVTLLTCLALIGAATAMPAAKTFGKSPAEYLGRAK